MTEETITTETQLPGEHGFVSPADYGKHLETQHGLIILADPGYPTERKRYRLVRGGQTLRAVVADYPTAAVRFYRYVHP